MWNFAILSDKFKFFFLIFDEKMYYLLFSLFWGIFNFFCHIRIPEIISRPVTFRYFTNFSFPQKFLKDQYSILTFLPFFWKKMTLILEMQKLIVVSQTFPRETFFWRNIKFLKITLFPTVDSAGFTSIENWPNEKFQNLIDFDIKQF